MKPAKAENLSKSMASLVSGEIGPQSCGYSDGMDAIAVDGI
jgi:hypothetical protein